MNQRCYYLVSAFASKSTQIFICRTSTGLEGKVYDGRGKKGLRGAAATAVAAVCLH